jgi:hypothetical protein
MQQLISDSQILRPPDPYRNRRICSNTGVHDLRGLCGSTISLPIMIKDKGTLALPFDSSNRHANLGSHKRAGK